MIKMSRAFKPGTVFQIPQDGMRGVKVEYVAVSDPFPHPDLPNVQIWAVPTRREGYALDQPQAELVDIGSAKFPTLWGLFVEAMIVVVVGAVVLFVIFSVAYLIAASWLQ